MLPNNIIIGIPLVPLSQLGITPTEVTITDEERFLPKLLVKYGFFKSTSQLRKNRSDLWRTLDKPDYEEIKIGHKRVWIVVGE